MTQWLKLLTCWHYLVTVKCVLWLLGYVLLSLFFECTLNLKYSKCAEGFYLRKHVSCLCHFVLRLFQVCCHCGSTDAGNNYINKQEEPEHVTGSQIMKHKNKRTKMKFSLRNVVTSAAWRRIFRHVCGYKVWLINNIFIIYRNIDNMFILILRTESCVGLIILYFPE